MDEQQDGKQNEAKPQIDKPVGASPQTPNPAVKPPIFDTVQRMRTPDASIKAPNFVQFSEGYDRNAGKPIAGTKSIVTTVPLKAVPDKNETPPAKE